MKQTTKLLTLGLVPAMLLCGCAKKCTFEEFVKAVEAIQEPDGQELDKMVVKGKINVAGTEYEVNKEFSEETSIIGLSLGDIAAATVLGVNHVSLYAITEDKDATYYSGSSFKLTKESLTLEWDKYGMCTKAKGELSGEKESEKYTVDLSASYSYKAITK